MLTRNHRCPAENSIQLREAGADVLVRDPYDCIHRVGSNRCVRIYRFGIGIIDGDASIAGPGDFLVTIGDHEIYGDVVDCQAEG